MGVIPFYFAHWEEYYSGTLILHALGNPTEVQLLICLAHYCTWLHGLYRKTQSWLVKGNWELTSKVNFACRNGMVSDVNCDLGETLYVLAYSTLVT
jgi:hypothetical protein